MISNPEHGWCDIQIGDWTGKLSYIDDVSVVLLNAFYNVFSNQKPEVVYFDAEAIYLYEAEQYLSALGVPIKTDANTYRNTMDIFADLSKLFNKTKNDTEYNVIKERDNENHQTRQT